MRPSRSPFDRSPRRGPRIGPVSLIALIALIGAGAVVGYGALSKTPPQSSAGHLHLPGLGDVGHLLASAGPCSARAYPPGAQYTFERCTSSTTPVTWKPCSRVTYSLDSAGAPAGSSADVQGAITDLASATGLHLVQVPGGADIAISWDSSLYNPRPGTSGEAGVTSYETTTGLAGARATSATIRMSSHLQAGSVPGLAEKPVLLHELGHAVGLGHYNGTVVMNPLDSGFAAYQPGDLAGLTALYHPSSC